MNEFVRTGEQEINHFLCPCEEAAYGTEVVVPGTEMAECGTSGSRRMGEKWWPAMGETRGGRKKGEPVSRFTFPFAVRKTISRTRTNRLFCGLSSGQVELSSTSR